MPTQILHIASSARPAGDIADGGSHSRALADQIIARLLLQHPGASVVSRDLAAEPIPHISDATIKGYYTPAEAMTEALRQATAQSDALIAELKAADAFVISAPIYNFSLPSSLKAWIDQIVRIGHSFAYEEGQFSGLIEDKPTFLALSYGAKGYAAGGPLSSMDFLNPYLTALMGFIGLSSVKTIAVEATTGDADTIAAEWAAATKALDAAFAAPADA